MKCQLWLTLLLLCFSLEISFQIPVAEKFKVCEHDEFYCNKTGKCLDEFFGCDGVIDCPDGSDERNCSNRSGGAYLGQYILKFKAQAKSQRSERETELLTTLSSYQDSDENSTLLTTKVDPVEKEIEFGNGTEPLKHFQHNSKDSAENSSLFSPSSDSNYFDVTSTETVKENATLTSEHSSEEDQAESSLSYKVNPGPRFGLKSLGMSGDNVSLVTSNKTYALNELISTNSESVERSGLRQLSNTVNDQPLLIRLIANLARKKEKITYEVEYVDKTALDKLLSVLYSKSKNDN